MHVKSGAYLATQESQNFGGDITEYETTSKLKKSTLIDIDKQFESKSGLILGLDLLLHCHFGSFCHSI